MGLNFLGGSSCAACESTKPPNPDPSNFVVLQSIQVGIYAILKIKYLDCTNFEGNKICVFKGSDEHIRLRGIIDPHFFEKSDLLARFVPTEEGFIMAVKLCNTLMKDVNKRW